MFADFILLLLPRLPEDSHWSDRVGSILPLPLYQHSEKLVKGFPCFLHRLFGTICGAAGKPIEVLEVSIGMGIHKLLYLFLGDGLPLHELGTVFHKPVDIEVEEVLLLVEEDVGQDP